MNKTKLTVRVDRDAFASAKQYAVQHGTTVTDLIEAFFRSLAKVNEIPTEIPILNELAGSLSAEVTLEASRANLEDKYFGDAGKDS